jgi:hypothetical protein
MFTNRLQHFSSLENMEVRKCIFALTSYNIILIGISQNTTYAHYTELIPYTKRAFEMC